jgi:4-hydroxybenzoate polyprenyltransferase
MRPREWIKNAFCLAGVVFSSKFTELPALLDALAVTAAFCLASGAAYLLNDVMDAEVDRHQPRTVGRPIARGDLSARSALAAAVPIALVALAITLALNLATAATLAGFLLLQVAYSLVLKHLIFLDVMAVAAGFVARAAAGSLAIGVWLSPWLLLCTALLSLLLGLAKRRGEAAALGGEAHPRRQVLEEYSVDLLDELIAVVTPSVVMSYALYCLLGAESDHMLFTLPFVLYGIFRLLLIIQHSPRRTEEPAVIAVEDRPLLACVVLWGLSAAAVALLT